MCGLCNKYRKAKVDLEGEAKNKQKKTGLETKTDCGFCLFDQEKGSNKS